ncbi:hypothetical protein [Texcoconibacillus texcoconensis]|uniref:Type II secretory pathway component PulK n=1 Tax=Texcoconibacillus texcoconensis TaxID=1095777 RepID=A0A840QRZ4_9BACI|nr:hypothetical protein [Texcoconibacillus texcoconensis]MBB5174109.1 type II secretory pathway component PulK [Texcoconibacillus texcoconensis]
MYRRVKGQTGVALPSALLVITVLMLVFMALAAYLVNEVRSHQTVYEQLQAKYDAEAHIETAFAEIENAESLSEQSDLSAFCDQLESTVSVDATCDEQVEENRAEVLLNTTGVSVHNDSQTYNLEVQIDVKVDPFKDADETFVRLEEWEVVQWGARGE